MRLKASQYSCSRGGLLRELTSFDDCWMPSRNVKHPKPAQDDQLDHWVRCSCPIDSKIKIYKWCDEHNYFQRSKRSEMRERYRNDLFESRTLILTDFPNEINKLVHQSDDLAFTQSTSIAWLYTLICSSRWWITRFTMCSPLKRFCLGGVEIASSVCVGEPEQHKYIYI